MVDISPESSIFGIFRSLKYQSWYALAEFVDNAIASWELWDKKVDGVSRPPKVRVEIELNTAGADPYIEIRDNSTGIAFADFDTAFKVASTPADQSSLHEFGMGMKTAGFWFSNRWSVRTSFVGDPVQRTIDFDLAKILADKTKNIDPVEVRIAEATHFTTIRLNDLNQIPYGKTIGKIKDHLSGIYREYLRRGDLELFYNGELLTYEEPETLVAPPANDSLADELTWRKEISFELSPGKNVKGFAGIRKTGNTTYAGFALLRKKRLIEGSSDATFRPEEIFGKSNSFSYQRLFGEFTLTGFKVTHTKDAIAWGEGELEAFITRLKEEVIAEPMNLIYQAEKYRSKASKPEPEKISEALENLKETLGLGLGQSIDVLGDKASDVFETPIPESFSSEVQLEASTTLTIDTHNHGLWKVRIVGFNDPAVTDLFNVSSNSEISGEDGKIHNFMEVRLNLGHPFTLQYIGANLENTELLFAFASCLAIALALGRSAGAKSAYIVDFLNEISRFRSVK